MCPAQEVESARLPGGRRCCGNLSTLLLGPLPRAAGGVDSECAPRLAAVRVSLAGHGDLLRALRACRGSPSGLGAERLARPWPGGGGRTEGEAHRKPGIGLSSRGSWSCCQSRGLLLHSSGAGDHHARRPGQPSNSNTGRAESRQGGCQRGKGPRQHGKVPRLEAQAHGLRAAGEQAPRGGRCGGAGPRQRWGGAGVGGRRSRASQEAGGSPPWQPAARQAAGGRAALAPWPLASTRSLPVPST
mmetsp:Transcript_39168/g.111776  ORF Transcript_39168/g.111776 Transcript_39168/m.111776 type:complete len:244 (+) Transcript_39168:564-1295(+)